MFAQEVERQAPAQVVSMNEYPWYALRVRTQKEKFIASSLRSRGYEDFLPLYSCTRRWSDRLQKIELPLFAGYLFCRFDFNQRLPILQTPGVIDIVGLGKLPRPVDEHEISSLQAMVGSGLLLQPWPFLRVGERVTIQEGPLRNVEGILTAVRGRDHLVVSVTLLQRSVAVSIERAWVRPLAS
jgi:transcription antitermination factor NusG